MPRVRGASDTCHFALGYTLKVLPDVVVAICSCHVHGHTYLQTKGSPTQCIYNPTANGNCYVREHLYTNATVNCSARIKEK